MVKYNKKQSYVRIITIMLCVIMALTAAGCGKKAEQKTEIKIGWVMPFTGPLAEWTRSAKFVGEQALEIINNQKGGIFIKEYNKSLPVRVIWADSEGDSAKASEVSRKLALDDKVDFLIGMITPDTVNPVSSVAEANNIPALVLSAPDGPWLGGGPYKWTYAVLFSAETMMDSYTTAMTRLDTNGKVGLVYDNSIDGITLSPIMTEFLERKGFTVVDPGRFPQNTTDYTTLINTFKNEGVEIITANLTDPDFATMWRQFHQQGFIPKMMNIAKAAHFTEGLSALGGIGGIELGRGCITDTFWEPFYPFTSSLSGLSAFETNRIYEEAMGVPANNTLGLDWAAFEIFYDVLTRAQTLDKEGILKALGQTNTTGSMGPVKFGENNLYQFPIVTVQWDVDSSGNWSRNIIANDRHPEIPLSNIPVFPIPGS